MFTRNSFWGVIKYDRDGHQMGYPRKKLNIYSLFTDIRRFWTFLFKIRRFIVNKIVYTVFFLFDIRLRLLL